MLTIVDIMTEEVFTIQASATVAEAIALMQDQKLRSLIVDRNDFQDSYGILTERDIVYKVFAHGRDPQRAHVLEVMRKPCIHLRPNMTLPEAAQHFQETGIQRAPVIQNGELIGIISITDLIMKQPIETQPPRDDLSQRIEKAIRHSRVINPKQEHIAHESAIAWEVKEAIDAEKTSPS
ncbi:MAG: CBS domain-containing protein [Cyanobacteria bacterium P01_D01_bin.44]